MGDSKENDVDGELCNVLLLLFFSRVVPLVLKLLSFWIDDELSVDVAIFMIFVYY